MFGYGHLRLKEENFTFDNISNIVNRNQHLHYLLDDDLKGVKRVEQFPSSIKCLIRLKFQFKSRDMILSIPIEKSQNFVCLIRFSSMVNCLYQVCET
jgi:hypothetical protein